LQSIRGEAVDLAHAAFGDGEYCSVRRQIAHVERVASHPAKSEIEAEFAVLAQISLAGQSFLQETRGDAHGDALGGGVEAAAAEEVKSPFNQIALGTAERTVGKLCAPGIRGFRLVQSVSRNRAGDGNRTASEQSCAFQKSAADCVDSILRADSLPVGFDSPIRLLDVTLQGVGVSALL